MELIFHTFDLPLLHPFTISRETITVQPTLIVELRDGDVSGFGEATTNAYYDATIDKMCEALEAVREEVESSGWENPEQLFDQLDEKLTPCPFAQCALDMAAHDLWGKKLGQPVWKLWGLNCESNAPSNYTIGIDEIPIMVEKMQEFANWPIYKIKLGTDQDIDIVRELRQHTDAVFRVDANCAWSADETIKNSHELKALGVQFIEQPMAAELVDEMPRVKQHSVLPLMADENCIERTDVAKCQHGFDGINIKLVKCGGMTPARRMINQARELGLKVMIGCMTESTVGISGIAQLLPMLDYVDMDGAALLSSDIASGAQVVNGICRYPDLGGTGVRLHSAT